MDQKPPQSTDTQPVPHHEGDTPPSAPQSGMDHSASTEPPVVHPGESHDALKPEEHHSEVPAAPTTPAPVAASPTGESQPSVSTPSGVSTPPPPSGAVPPGSPGQPHDLHAHKSNAMLFAVVTLVIVLIGAVLVTIMSTSNGEQPAATVVQPAEEATITEVPTPAPSPSVGTPEEEVEAINVTEDDKDLQEVEQDLQNL